MSLTENKTQIELQPTLVLHRRNYLETSLIVELLTHSFGRIAVVAKGARRAKGKTGLLQPFQLLSCSWVSRSELGTLTQVELAQSQHNEFSQPRLWQPQLQGSALYCGLYLNELIMRCTQRGHGVDGLMDSYMRAIDSLGAAVDEAVVMRQFEWEFINLLGLGASLYVDNHNRAIVAEKYYHYITETGLVETAAQAPVAISGKSIIELANNNWHNIKLQKDARKLTSQALKSLVGDKPFASRSLYVGLKKQQQNKIV